MAKSVSAERSDGLNWQSVGQTSKKLTTAGIQPTVHVLMIRKVMRAALKNDIFHSSYETGGEDANQNFLFPKKLVL